MACLVQGKHPGLAIIGVLIGVIRVIFTRITEKSCLLRHNRSNNSSSNRLSFDTLKTGGCKPARTMREGCGCTEPGVCIFVLGTYPQRGSVPPPPPQQPPVPCLPARPRPHPIFRFNPGWCSNRLGLSRLITPFTRCTHHQRPLTDWDRGCWLAGAETLGRGGGHSGTEWLLTAASPLKPYLQINSLHVFSLFFPCPTGHFPCVNFR